MCDAVGPEAIDLPLDIQSAAVARRFIADILCGAHCSAVAADAILLTSELVTNAAMHGGPPIHLVVECTGDAVEVRVHDGSSTQPVARAATDQETDGRGLMLVDLLSAEWGVDLSSGGGKDTWFRLTAV